MDCPDCSKPEKVYKGSMRKITGLEWSGTWISGVVSRMITLYQCDICKRIDCK